MPDGEAHRQDLETSRGIGIFGGTFDPVHVGHLVAAMRAREALSVDKMFLVVANEPWQKVGSRSLTPAEDRFAVVEEAVAGIAGLEASRIEIDRGGPSYTFDTVLHFREIWPERELFLVVGADVASEMRTWSRSRDLRDLVTLVVVDRGQPVSPDELGGWRVRRVAVPALEISSSDLRQRLSQGQSVEFLIPEPAIRCILSRGLYAYDR